MEWLNYHHLFYFRVIAMEGSIAKAAEKLLVGQPTLSAQLRQLEAAVGRSLFERRNRRLVLTEAGRAALEYAHEIFQLGDEMLEVLRDRTPQNQPHLQIGALDSVPKSVILQLVMEAYKIAPCTVSILEGKGDELIRELQTHKIDLLVSNYPAPSLESSQLYSRSVAKLSVAVYGSKKFQALKKGFPQSLREQAFVFPTYHSKLCQDLMHYFKLNGIKINPVAETQDTSLQKLLAENGVGVAPISEVPGQKEQGLIRLGRLKGVYEEIWLMSAQRRIENPVAAALIKGFKFY